MGFMDKAKKLAEQAQDKLDEAQKQFNERQGSSGGSGAPPVEYDQHGRPVTPPQTATPPHGDPLGEQAAPPPPAPPAPPPAATTMPDPAAPAAPVSETPPAQPVPPSSDAPSAPTAAPVEETPGVPRTEDDDDDPNQPPKMSSGDPLAGT
jgi:hypothetical protein